MSTRFYRAIFCLPGVKPLYRRQYRFRSNLKASWHSFRDSSAFWFLRRSAKAIQVGIVATAIYQAGYSSGAVNFATNPSGFSSFLSRDSYIDGHIDDNEISRSERYAQRRGRVEAIAERIIHASVDLCHLHLRAAEARLHNAEENILSNSWLIYDRESIINSFEMRDRSADELKQWQNALLKVEGKWKVILTTNKSEINAFVADIAPRQLYIEYGLLVHMKPTDDELAMILGHEMSHCLLGHSSRQIERNAIAKLFQLVFLSLVDQGGIFSLLLELMSFEVCDVFSSSMLKRNEFEADSLGQQIMRLANFDAAAGSQIFLKEASMLAESKQVKRELPWRSSHPDSVERYYKLAEERLDSLEFH